MLDLATFTVRCLRHPRHHPQAYNTNNHRYSRAYVQPDTWLLELDATAPVRVIEPQDAPDDLPRAEPEDHAVIRIPADVTSYRWRVERDQRHGGFVEVASRSAGRVAKSTVEVPTEGAREARFRVRLTVDRTSGADPTATLLVRLQDYLIVSLGDSYASGQGNPDPEGDPKDPFWKLGDPLVAQAEDAWSYYQGWCPELDDEPGWVEPNAYRSWISGPSFGIRRIQQFAGRGGQPGEWVTVAPTFLSFASDGAKLANLSTVRQHFWQDGHQVAEAKAAVGDRPVDAVLVSAGGNDLGFADMLTELNVNDLELPEALLVVIHAASWPLSYALLLAFIDKERARAAAKRALDKALPRIAGRYRELARVVADELNPRRVFVTGYPPGLFDRENGLAGGCGIFDLGPLDIDGADIELIRDFGEGLNETIRTTIGAINSDPRTGSTLWIWIGDVAERFAGHGYCANEPYFRAYSESCAMQGDYKGTMHPNAAGHREYGLLIADALTRFLLPGGPSPNAPRRDLDVSPAFLTFGPDSVGSIEMKSVELVNAGDVDLTVSVPTQSGTFRWSPVNTRLRPGEKTSILVRYVPTVAGTQRVDLVVTSESPASPHRVAVTGRAIDHATPNPNPRDPRTHPE
jgi:hypothetical protein